MNALEPRTATFAQRLRLRRRSLWQLAALILLFGVVDAYTVGATPWLSLGIRAVWAAFVVLTSLVEPRTDAALAMWSRVVSWVSVPAMALVIHVTGGNSSLLLLAFPCLPLIAVLFTDPRGSKLTTLLCVVVVGVLTWAGGAPASLIAGWTVLTGLMGLTAILGGRHLVKAQELTVMAERRIALAERAKVEALEKLAASERRAAHSERLALVGSLASGVAHEINNPLAFAKSSARYLHEQLGATADEEIRLAFEDVTVGLVRIEQIVQDLRNFSREDREGPCRVEVRALVDESVRIASVRLHGAATVDVEVEDGLAPLLVSPGRVVQVLVNLLVNAADALETAQPRVDSPRLWVKAREQGDMAELTVEDNGPGIAADVLPRIFQPFFTTKPVGKGTGLGLAVSLDYCARMGGTLTAENRAEGGARFTVRLPREALPELEEAPALVTAPAT